MTELTTPIRIYKAIIDQLVNETRCTGFSSFVETRELFSNIPDHQQFNDFVRSLSSEQRHLIAQMLQAERDNTIHDVLANLTWWMTCRDVSLSVCGHPMPSDLSGMGLHGDYIGRRDGWDWPTESGSNDA